ncbi:MAG: hypothetical protein AMXMBFR34_31800 [Myxococcaceae bacterium]
MAHKVLGNDPFKRGAAQRGDLPAAPQPPTAPQKGERAPEEKARPDTPELQTPKGKKAPAPRPPPVAPRITPAPPARPPIVRHAAISAPVAHPGSPKVKGEATDPKALPVPQPASPRSTRALATPQAGTPAAKARRDRSAPQARQRSPRAPFDPSAHDASPEARPLGSAPRPHPGSPSVPFEASVHDASPEARPLGSAPRPHPGSPSVPFEASAHDASPEARPLGSAPRPHPGSPSVPFEASAHDASPEARPLGSAPRPHPGSPSVPFEASAHDATPDALGSPPRPHAGSPSVPFEPATHPGVPEGSALGSADGGPGSPLSPPGAPETTGDAGTLPRPLATPYAGAHSVTRRVGPPPSAPHPADSGAPPPSPPRAHGGSPSVVFEAFPHPSAPSGVPLGAGPRAHSGSPSAGFEPAFHGGLPEPSAPLHPGRAHQSSRHASPPGATVDGPRAHQAEADEPHADAPGETVFGDEPPAHHTPEGPPRALARPAATLPDALKGLWRALRTVTGLPTRSTEVDAWGKDAELTRQLRPLGELLYEKYWRVHVEGVGHVPRGPCLLVANHAGALPLDGPVLHLTLKRERPELADARWLLEDQVFHAPFVGLLANRLGAVRASPDNALKLLDEGRPLIVFPEGFHGLSKPFSDRYQLRRFGRGGYLKIALRAGVPVVPVAIVGGEESMPLFGKLPGGFFGVEYLPLTLPPLPARWFIRFAPPIDFTGAPQIPEDDLAWIERTNLAVRDQIEAMLGELLAGRSGVF